MRSVAYSVLRAALFVFALLCIGCLVFLDLSYGLAPGGMWSTPFNCSNSVAHSEDASIVVDHHGWVHVVWSENGQILHRVFNEYGWSEIATVRSGHSPSLAADSQGNVYMAFAAQSSGADDVFFASWQAASGWSLPVNVSESSAPSASPWIAVADDGELAIVWSEQDAGWTPIFLGLSVDGELWTTMPIPDAYGSCPVLAFGPAGDLWVAWQDVFDVGFPTEIFVSQGTESEWTLPEDVSYSIEVDSILPSIAVWEGKVCLAWQEGAPGEEAIYWTQWVDGAWDWPQKRSGMDRAFAPTLAVDASGYGHLVWTTEDTVQYTAWNTSTGMWGSVENVALGQIGAADACLAVNDTAHVVWLAEAASTAPDVYYSKRGVLDAIPTATATLSTTPTQTATVAPSATPVATATPTISPSPSTRIFLPLVLRKL